MRQYRSRGATYLPVEWWMALGRAHPRQQGRVMILARDREHALGLVGDTGARPDQARAIVGALRPSGTWVQPWTLLREASAIDPGSPGIYLTRRGLPGDPVLAVTSTGHRQPQFTLVAHLVGGRDGLSAAPVR